MWRENGHEKHNYGKNIETICMKFAAKLALKVHKLENFFGTDFVFFI